MTLRLSLIREAACSMLSWILSRFIAFSLVGCGLLIEKHCSSNTGNPEAGLNTSYFVNNCKSFLFAIGDAAGDRESCKL